MDSIRTVNINNQVQPIALSRSSIKVIKNSSPDNNKLKLNSISTFTHHPVKNQLYSNIENYHQSTNINIERTSTVSQDVQPKHIKLVITNKNNSNIITNNNSIEQQQELNRTTTEQDTYLSTLVDEYQTSLSRKDCDNTSCYRFKSLSYRISQTLFDRIATLRDDLNQVQEKSYSLNKSTKALMKQSSFRSSDSSKHSIDTDEMVNMDKESLMNLVVEKNKRIRDLERLVEDQRRLRLQDANQVEEKAARIKEWVANKLKELENQNKQLRDQNRKQKEAADMLSNRLATISPITTPRRINNSINSDSVQYIDKTSPMEDKDVDESNKSYTPQLKNPAISSSSDNNQLSHGKANNHHSERQENQTSREAELQIRHDSPVYDCVTIEQINRRNNQENLASRSQNDDSAYSNSDNFIPPPPPLHQSDKWERQLYNMAEQTFSSLMYGENVCKESLNTFVSIESYSDRESSTFRKSSSSLKNDLISLVKPAFTTIDGDNVVDDIMNSNINTTKSSQLVQTIKSSGVELNEVNDHSSNLCYDIIRKRSIDSYEQIDKPSMHNLFDSPMRSRTGKDSILRTQSVRRNPAPEKLYDYITADLIKRGYLIKPGALKNHNRWFVLKNFHLYSYKNEQEETTKAIPNIMIKLVPGCHVYPINQSNESSFPFKIAYLDKPIQLIAETAHARDEWIRILTVAINLSDIEPDALTKNNATYEGLLNVTKLGHTKRCNAILVNHVIFFLKSLTDPSPTGYLSVKGGRIREITDNYDYNMEEHELFKQKSNFQDCSLAIYPKFSMTLDPIYITLGGQQETDKWFHYLSVASGVDQSHGTEFERTLTKLMINNSMTSKKDLPGSMFGSGGISGCPWKDHSVMLYCDRPITHPLTSLPNETLRVEAIELFKSILLITQVPLEPIAIDYHVSLLQNCLSRFLKYPELRNEFFAQLMKQCTYVLHRCNSSKLSSSSSGCSTLNQRSSSASISPSLSDCQFVTDVELLETIATNRGIKFNGNCSQHSLKDKNDNSIEDIVPPSQSELLQVMQILAIVVSLNLPRGRMRWWLIDYLGKFANPSTNIGKYALYTLRAIDRTVSNGPRDNIPSRTEIMSILLRNPFDHSSPHSLPISFSDGSYLVVEADGSTTVEEFMVTMTKNINIRHSSCSDFYLFADDPSGSKELHILEPQRKVLDIVGWWEQTFRRHNSGRYQTTRVIKLLCKKRLVLRSEQDETQQERLLIVHQMHQEVVLQKIPLSETLALELAAMMVQLTQGNFDKSKDFKWVKMVLNNYLPNKSSQVGDSEHILEAELLKRWQHLSDRSAQDCVRIYLNCMRRLKITNYEEM